MNPNSCLLVAAILVAGHAGAQECSGGPGGGMDATGVQCNNPPPTVVDAVASVAPKAGLARPAPQADAIREQALVEYATGHFQAAAMHLQQAGHLGDARSAELLSLMYRHGERLYGNGFRADPALASYWAGVAASLRSGAATGVTTSGR